MGDLVTIHCVDDDKVNRMILKEILSEYDCVLLESGQACLDAAQQNIPDIILLDVMMPDLNGLETCQKIRAIDELHDIPVMFLSASVTLEARLEGYLAGGDDYVTKPFEEEELLAKVKATIVRKKMLEAARKEATAATTSSMNFMTSMGEMSSVVHFLQTTFSCRSYDALAQKILQAHESLGLEIAIELLVDGEKIYYCTANVENPLEQSVFDFVRSKGRLLDFGERTAVNFPYVVIIVRNMPVEDKDRHGRIRDHIALIGQGADTKLRTLMSDNVLKSQREDLIQIISQLEGVVKKIDTDYKGQQMCSTEILSAVALDLEDSFMNLGLTSEQEELLRVIIENAETKIKALYDLGLALDEQFSTVLNKITETLSRSVVEEEPEDEADTSEDAIELF